MRYIRFDNSNSKLLEYQRGHMLYLYAISTAIATTTLKYDELGILGLPPYKKHEIIESYIW